MPEQTFRKREIAHKLRIGDILKGQPIIEQVQQENQQGVSSTPAEVQSDLKAPEQTQQQASQKRERFKFLELGDKKIIRTNIISNVIDKFISDNNRYASITLDDASGQLRCKVFGDDVSKFQDIDQGDTLLIIGVLRSYNNELYLLPEIIKKIDPKYLLVRKLELEKQQPTPQSTQDTNQTQTQEAKQKIIELIKQSEDQEGIDTEKIIMNLKDISADHINNEITSLIKEGTIYEPRPGKVRYIG